MKKRSKNGGKTLLRRSSSRQETSLEQQLDWAISKARELGVPLDASQADLTFMQKTGICKYKDLYLDNSITGSDLLRPGLTAMLKEVTADRNVSHVFIYHPDRLARPEEPLDGVAIETGLRNVGVTIEFSNRTGLPRDRSANNIADSVMLLFQYTEAGQYLNNLAQRVIEGQVHAAELGAWTGGRAPYGFTRVLVDANGNVIQELHDGMRIRQEGCRTRIKPGDADKIRVWVLILHWYAEELIGATKIAQRLNALGIPSPDAGRSRRDGGIKHRVSGRWGCSTVLSLIRNRAIIGEHTYGVQSEGKFRRLGERGPRLLLDTDSDGSKPKVIRNDPSIVITRPSGFDPSVDIEIFQAVQQRLEERGKSQRGISRRSDPGRYPLALHVFDMSDSCGHPMYALTSGNRALYKCGLYMKTAGAECSHNAVDAEAALRFVLNELKRAIDRVGGREALKRELLILAKASQVSQSDNAELQFMQKLELHLADAENELALISRNLARAKDEVENDAIRSEWLRQKNKVAKIREQIEAAKMSESKNSTATPEAHVESALSLYDETRLVVDNASARKLIPALLDKMNLQLWLNFTEGKKGTRKIRVLQGGVLMTGNGKTPVRPYGKYADGADSQTSPGGIGMLPMTVGVNDTPSISSFSQSEDVSLTMLHRGDKI